MTKKKIVALLVLLFMLTMTLMGCAGSADQNQGQNNQQAGSTVTTHRFGGSGTSTWIYSFCVAISEMLNQELDDIQLNVQATAGSSSHYGMLEKDQIDLGSGSTYIDSLPYNSYCFLMF